MALTPREAYVAAVLPMLMLKNPDATRAQLAEWAHEFADVIIQTGLATHPAPPVTVPDSCRFGGPFLPGWYP